MDELQPFLRYIDILDHFTNKFFTKAYDCRFLYMIEGVCLLKTEFGNFTLKPNTLAYYPAGISYLPEKCAPKIRFVTINFDFTQEYAHRATCLHPVQTRLFQENLCQPTYRVFDHDVFSKPFVLASVPFLEEELRQLMYFNAKNSRYSSAIISSILKTILQTILFAMSDVETSNSIVIEIQKYIEANYKNRINNESIAKAIKYHSYYINSVFKKHTGKTIHKYLMEYRITESKKLLITTKKSIEEISELCGFLNAAHFSSYFKKINNISPIDYRKKSNLI